MTLEKNDTSIEFEGNVYAGKRWTERVDAERAEHYLSNSIGNRNFNKAHLRRIKQSLQDGRFVDLKDPVRLADTGQLMDGHTRLTAIFETKIPVSLEFYEGFPKGMFKYLDQHGARTVANALEIEGVENAGKVATGLKQLAKLVEGRISVENESNLKCLDAYERHPGLGDSTTWAIAMAKSLSFGGTGVGKSHGPPVAPFAVCHYLYSKADPSNGKAFFDGFMHGPRTDAKDPRNVLWSKFQDEMFSMVAARGRGAFSAWSYSHCFIWIHDAWLHFQSGKPLEKSADLGKVGLSEMSDADILENLYGVVDMVDTPISS